MNDLLLSSVEAFRVSLSKIVNSFTGQGHNTLVQSLCALMLNGQNIKMSVFRVGKTIDQKVPVEKMGALVFSLTKVESPGFLSGVVIVKLKPQAEFL